MLLDRSLGGAGNRSAFVAWMARFRVPEVGFACGVNCDFCGSGVSASGMKYNAGRREATFPLFCFRRLERNGTPPQRGVSLGESRCKSSV
jgi:hypothetical protein